MSDSENRFALPGSEQPLLKGRRAVGRPGPGERIDVTVLLRHSDRDLVNLPQRESLDRDPPTPEEFFRRFRADDPDVETCTNYFTGIDGLEILESRPERASIAIRGTVQALEEVFGVNLAYFEVEGGRYVGYQGEIRLPGELHDAEQGETIIMAVLGLADVPLQRSSRLEWFTELDPPRYSPQELAQIYKFPDSAGDGQRIFILCFGGGFYEEDIIQYFRCIGLPVPHIEVLPTPSSNNPAPRREIVEFLTQGGPLTDAVAATLEATMDLELVGAFANSAEITVFFLPSFDTTSLHGGLEDILFLGDSKLPAIISASFAFMENYVPPMVISVVELLLWALTRIFGITSFYASGDYGSNPLGIQVMWPASSPWVVGCGGTRLETFYGCLPSTQQGTLVPEAEGFLLIYETAWNGFFELVNTRLATGGGVSDFFKKIPPWQEDAGIPEKTGLVGRGVPDIAADADPETGVTILIVGFVLGSAGTSASAPIWAGLTARINQALGRNVGYFNPILYEPDVAATFRDITCGNNFIPENLGPYNAGLGWDPCTGLGTPNGVALLDAIEQLLEQR